MSGPRIIVGELQREIYEQSKAVLSSRASNDGISMIGGHNDLLRIVERANIKPQVRIANIDNRRREKSQHPGRLHMELIVPWIQQGCRNAQSHHEGKKSKGSAVRDPQSTHTRNRVICHLQALENRVYKMFEITKIINSLSFTLTSSV